MTLYELTGDYLQLLEMGEDPETDQEAFNTTLEMIGDEIEDKADGYAKVIKMFEGDIAILKKEEERLSERRKTIESRIKTMKTSLEGAMRTTGKVKFKTKLFSFGIQKNPPSLVMDEPYIENIPKKYLIMQDPKVDTAQIKKDLNSGIKLDGIAHLEQGESLRIR